MNGANRVNEASLVLWVPKGRRALRVPKEKLDHEAHKECRVSVDRRVTRESRAKTGLPFR